MILAFLIICLGLVPPAALMFSITANSGYWSRQEEAEQDRRRP